MPRRLVPVAALLLVAGLLFLLAHRSGELSITWDEGGDLGIVGCIQDRGDPFKCREDISQTRLPFLIHAAAGPAWEPKHPAQYRVSIVFSLLTLGIVAAFARHVYGARVAWIAAALYVTCIPLLASGRMLLTHSAIIVTFFTTAAFVTVLLYARDGRWRWMVLCAVASGAAAASSLVAVLSGPAILGVYLSGRRYAWRDLLFVPMATATFFATSPIYLHPENLKALIGSVSEPLYFPFWNVFGTGSPFAPWWFPPLMFVVKIGPWWLLLAAGCAFRVRPERPLVAFAGGFLVYLALKGLWLRYETPHHQVTWYPMLLVILAVLIAGARGRVVALAFAACLAVQLYDVARFFPNYLFYAAQYGPRFIGEFYGPAVMHAQGRDPFNRAVDRILIEEPWALILVADNNILERNDPRLVPFTRRDPTTRYDYAVVDRLYAEHFRFPERDAYNQYLARHYEPHWTQYFPPRVWAYRILRRRD